MQTVTSFSLFPARNFSQTNDKLYLLPGHDILYLKYGLGPNPELVGRPHQSGCSKLCRKDFFDRFLDNSEEVAAHLCECIKLDEVDEVTAELYCLAESLSDEEVARGEHLAIDINENEQLRKPSEFPRQLSRFIVLQTLVVVFEMGIRETGATLEEDGHFIRIIPCEL